jgi:hypothetical protein
MSPDPKVSTASISSSRYPRWPIRTRPTYRRPDGGHTRTTPSAPSHDNQSERGIATCQGHVISHITGRATQAIEGATKTDQNERVHSIDGWLPKSREPAEARGRKTTHVPTRSRQAQRVRPPARQHQRTHMGQTGVCREGGSTTRLGVTAPPLHEGIQVLSQASQARPRPVPRPSLRCTNPAPYVPIVGIQASSPTEGMHMGHAVGTKCVAPFSQGQAFSKGQAQRHHRGAPVQHPTYPS